MLPKVSTMPPEIQGESAHAALQMSAPDLDLDHPLGNNCVSGAQARWLDELDAIGTDDEEDEAPQEVPEVAPAPAPAAPIAAAPEPIPADDPLDELDLAALDAEIEYQQQLAAARIRSAEAGAARRREFEAYVAHVRQRWSKDKHQRPPTPDLPLPDSGYTNAHLEWFDRDTTRRRNIYQLDAELEGRTVRPYHRAAHPGETPEEAKARRKADDAAAKAAKRAAMTPEEKAAHKAKKAEAEKQRRARKKASRAA